MKFFRVFSATKNWTFKHVAALGIGTSFVGAIIAPPVGQVVALGLDHIKPAYDQRVYDLRYMFSSNRPDVVLMYSCDWATAGNIVTLHNQENYGDKDLRVQAEMQVRSAVFKGVEYEIPTGAGSKTFNTEYGVFTFFRNGFYVYFSEQAQPIPSHSEVVSLKLLGDGRESEAVELQINVYRTERTANKMADYGNQTKGQNYEIDGVRAYASTLESGAMVLGFEDVDYLFGTHNDDAVFGWTGGDKLSGLDGNDFLSGEQEGNRLIGGPGADVFFIEDDKADGASFDVVEDFSLTEFDVIVLTDVVSIPTQMDNGSLDEFIRLKATAEYLDVLVTTPRYSTEFSHVVRLLAGEDFDPRTVSLVELWELGKIQG